MPAPPLLRAFVAPALGSTVRGNRSDVEQSSGSPGAGRWCLVVETADQVADAVVAAELFGWQVLSVTTRQDRGVVEVLLEPQAGQGRGPWG